ncbi:calcium-binding protein [Saccharothrix sp. BKS2]|uniref:calcium-binding protein n=1 Tax=Saccharothrix sp. BKS2 TaxID=3064400 RepID=UPI0039ED930D
MRTVHRSAPQAAAALALAVVAGLLTGTAAHADAYGGKVWLADGVIHFVAAEGYANDVTAVCCAAQSRIAIRDAHPIELVGAGCQYPDPSDKREIACGTPSTPVEIHLGDLADTLAVREPMSTIHGGAGDDVIGLGLSEDVVDGGEGDDTVNTAASGQDLLQGGSGYDVVHYEPGLAQLHDDVVKTDVEKIENGAGHYTLSDGLVGTVGVGGAQLAFTAASGHANSTTITLSPDADRYLVDDSAPVLAADGCEHPDHADTTLVGCDATGVQGLLALGGDQADLLDNRTATPSTLVGGPGDDALDGGAGPDLLRGEGGADVFRGREGRDTADYAGHRRDVTAGIGGPAGDDGEPGEGDTVTGDVEDLRGGLGTDHLTGDDGPNLLDGGAGADVLSGLDGDDELHGGPGVDHLDGGPGVDRLDGGADGATCTAGELTSACGP